jgi:hypothetical protein
MIAESGMGKHGKWRGPTMDYWIPAGYYYPGTKMNKFRCIERAQKINRQRWYKVAKLDIISTRDEIGTKLSEV